MSSNSSEYEHLFINGTESQNYGIQTFNVPKVHKKHLTCLN